MIEHKKTSSWFKDRYSGTPAANLIGSIKVPNNKFTMWYHWGTVTLFFFLLQCLTGILLSIYYKPTAEDAFSSVKYISDTVEFGSFIRSIHYWCSHLLIASALIQFLSAFFLKAYRKPRELMWVIGVAFIFVLMLFAYTGEILPWNELSYFGAAIGISQIERLPLIGSFAAEQLRGSGFIGTAAISRYYSLHSLILPVLAIILVIAQVINWHIFGPSSNRSAESKGEPIRYYFNFLNRSLIFSLSILSILMLAATFIPKGTGIAYDIWNPSEAPAGIHPEWYFMWLYQLLKADVILPEIIIQLILCMSILFWFFVPNLDKRLSLGRSGNIISRIGLIFIAAIIVLTVWAYVESGIYTTDMIINSKPNLGGMDIYSFAAIMVLPIGFLIMLLYIKTKSRTQ